MMHEPELRISPQPGSSRRRRPGTNRSRVSPHSQGSSAALPSKCCEARAESPNSESQKSRQKQTGHAKMTVLRTHGSTRSVPPIRTCLNKTNKIPRPPGCCNKNESVDLDASPSWARTRPASMAPHRGIELLRGRRHPELALGPFRRSPSRHRIRDCKGGHIQLQRLICPAAPTT